MAQRVEESFAGSWREILSRDDTSARADFFELGGSSIKAMRTVTTVLSRLELRIDPIEVIISPRYEGLFALPVERDAGGVGHGFGGAR